MTMLRQWNSLSEDCETTLSTTSRSGFALSQRVITSPSSSRSFALVAEKTFTPVNCIALSLRARPRRPSVRWLRSSKGEYCRGVAGCQTTCRALPLDPVAWYSPAPDARNGADMLIDLHVHSHHTRGCTLAP